MKRFALISGLIGALVCAGAQAQPRGHQLPADNLTQLSAHVWAIEGGSPTIAIVVGHKATLIVDDGLGTPNGRIVLDAAHKLSTNGQKLYLTTTHYHAEHATGDGAFPADTVLVRPRVQQAELEAEGQKLVDLFAGRSPDDKALLQDMHYLKPGILFDSDYRLDLGGVKVRLAWFGPAHTRGDEVVMVEPDSVLISGDVVQNKAAPYFYCSECTPESWLAVVDKIAAQFHPKIVVPDHSPPGNASLIAETRAFMASLATRIQALKAEGKSADEAGKIVTAEMQAKYPDWGSLNRLQLGVTHAYAQ
ncbi:MAG: MBL fold metallo-hydrolase [Alphaproteobacteria bacterium]|nr:MBL fold metallo-hydrolase [Alphaproteobacteria bacterium]MBW8749695.1 MBL fold metallo-hydrolase [Acidobacteriota bacterium]